ncbi:MAG: dihydrofolate reductase family protein [Bacteroidales bacterium]|nr:dihydrofolate reductase family protein [Bacteroidales bacterium]
MKNIVFIATSLDGYIADKNGGLDWLDSIPNPDKIEMGFDSLIKSIDAFVMGRTTFETICNFDIDWPYSKPVFVLSRTLEKIPEKYKDKAELIKGSITEILKEINQRGYSKLYIDGGKTIQSFLKEDLIDELIITTIPVLLGGGTTLFSELPEELEFSHVETKVFLDEIVQNHYKRKR